MKNNMIPSTVDSDANASTCNDIVKIKNYS